MSDFISIFFSPRRVFGRVRQKGIWIPAFLAVIVLSVMPTIMVISTAGIELLTLQRYQHNPRLAERIGGDPGIERAVSSSNDRWTKLLVVSRVFGAAGAGLLFLAGAFTLAVSFFENRPNYFVMLGTVCYAAFPSAVLSVVISALFLLSFDATSLDLENMPALNLGRFLDRESSSPAIFAMASQMDLLLIAALLLMSVGLNRVTKLNLFQCLAICGSIWAIVVMWNAVLAVYS